MSNRGFYVFTTGIFVAGVLIMALSWDAPEPMGRQGRLFGSSLAGISAGYWIGLALAKR